MYLPDFDYYAPDSLAETCEALERFGAKAKVLSGGSDIIAKMKSGLLSPEVLISLKKLEDLKKIDYVSGKGVVIGALSTHNDLVNSKILNDKYLSVSEAAHNMASNQIRNIGTVGGNLCNAVPSADLPPILIALGATIKLVGTKGERVMLLEDLFTGPMKTVIAENEILTEIVIPDQSSTGSNYIKFGLRRSGALAVVGIAVAVTVNGGTITEAKIAIGAAAPTPIRAREAEKFLQGKTISDDLLAEAGVIASGESKPISDIRGSAEYRRDLIRVLTRRALHKAINEGHV
ncbi:xanthine dehydrogenase family protein subunit M [Desulfosporosinus sp.]|uniref:FAD binding domain-containing protein n=1 Tax=Desulfosporosinus sp. TaxID=157907 RepID=UPI0023122CCC|nr:xanthine dehydrogenase family protein subunit M [Desulfosporosinus sp.]MCO5385093.1 xanthine dehydrogenase family protein subunit M [Desulfosporosinus sp.]MDA8220617.1 xanthine dehydrogenase family protein subunit M [Desulfitobacterium hafniense]